MSGNSTTEQMSTGASRRSTASTTGDTLQETRSKVSLLSKIWSNVVGVLLCKGDLVGEDAEQRAVSFTELFRFASKYDIVLIMTGCLLTACGGILQPGGMIIAGLLTSVILEHDTLVANDSFLKEMTPYLIAFLVIGLLGFIFTFFGSYWLLRGCNKMVRTIREEYLTSVLRQDAAWFARTSSGAITSQLNTNIQKIEEGLGNKFGMLIRGFSMYFASFAFSLFISWRLALICLISGPLAAWVLAITGRVTAKYNIAGLRLSTEASIVVEEAVMNVKTVAACNAQEHMVEKYSGYLKRNLPNVLKFEFWSGFFEGINLLLCYIVLGVNMWYGIIWYFEGIISKPADAILVGNTMTMTSYQLAVLGPHMMSMLKARVAAAAIYETIDREVPSQTEDGVVVDDIQGDIELRDVKFAYPGRDTMVLNGISWTAKSGTAVALVGKSGSGKSTSIGLLTRLYEVMEGSITIDGIPINEIDMRSLRQRIGLVEQDVCLFNGTIMENIIIGRQVTEEAAKRAAVVAKADEFISQLKEGYDTVLGVGGVALSGGQKQRLAIARAIATDPRILLLDEATSALDSESEKVVQAALNRAAEGRTTIIVAHRLSTLKDVNTIYVVEKGQIVEEGTHDGLIAAGGVYAQLARSQEIEVAGAVTPDSTQWSSNRPIAAASTRSAETANLLEPLSNREEKQTSWLGLSHLYGNVSGDCKKFLLAILFSFLRCFEMILVVVGNSIAFDALSPQYHDSHSFYARLALAIFLFCGAIQVIIEPLLHLFSGWTAENVVGRLRVRALRSLLYRPMESFDVEGQSAAACVTTIAKYAQPCLGAFNFNFAYNVSNIFAVIVAEIGCYYYSWEVGTLTLGLCTVLLLILLVNQMIGNSAHSHKAKNDRTAELSIEIVEQARTIQLLTVEDHFLARYSSHQEETLCYDKGIAIVESMHYATSQVFPILGDFSSWLLLSRLGYAGSHETGELFRAVSFTSVALWSILYSAPYIPDYVKAGSAAQQLFKVIDDEASIQDTIEAGHYPEITGKVTLNNVDFAYPSRPDLMVSRQLTLDVNAGKSIALVGTSGSGKSTVINLLERFYIASNGTVYLDKYDVCSINLRHLRSQVALVSQEPILFKGSIIENITMGAGQVPLSKVIDACRTANACSFIEAFPEGYETDVGEKGKALSGGQKQRIAIARALVRDPKIILLDEATSALDLETEKIVQKAINDASIGRTSITVAHRLSSIQNCDMIYVIERGAVVESGTHRKLLKRDGRYAKLVAAQMLNA